MSSAQYFSDEFAINPYMDESVAIDSEKANQEHAAIRTALMNAGVTVKQVEAPKDCQDGVYTANWGLCRNGVAVLSSLPNKRQAEQPYAKQTLENLDLEVIEAPYRFSGQGDALPCGDLLFCGTTYRTDKRMHDFLAKHLGFTVIGLETVPYTDQSGKPLVNTVTGWPDSFFYDIDLALSVLTPNLIAWCPEAFTPESQAKIRSVDIDTIEVSYQEATKGFACNLVSTGETVVMSAHAPKLRAAIEAKGLKTVTPQISELAKGGGYIRCTTLTVKNR